MMQAKTCHLPATHRMKYHISGIYAAEPGTFPCPAPPLIGGGRARRAQAHGRRACAFLLIGTTFSIIIKNRNDYD